MHIAALAIFLLSLALGVVLLRLRDVIFGPDVGKPNNYHHIDFNKKIVEEEQLNLDEISKGNNKRGVGRKLDTASFGNRNRRKRRDKAGHRD